MSEYMHETKGSRAEDKSFYTRELLSWYRRGNRDLPWRRSKNPYYIWVSEIMLQQTRVETVIPYFHRFIEKFPTVEALAEAPEEEVLKAWEGLGYYSRARNLQAAVREVKETYGGVVPADKEEISSLKGVGPYTAGAILSIAYGIPEPAVDGNVMRVLSRFFLLEEDIAKPAARTAIERLARELIPEGAAGDFNQALMELGATVCTPRSPHCLTCPVMERCGARLEGRVDELPVKSKAKPPRPERRAAAFIIDTGANAGRLLIRQRPAEGLLARMWELPHVALPAAEAKAGRAAGAGMASGAAGGEAACVSIAAVSEASSESKAAGEAAAAEAAAREVANGRASTSEAAAGHASAGTAARESMAAAHEAAAAVDVPAVGPREAAMRALAEGLAAADGLRIVPEEWLTDAEHTFSHLRWDMQVFRCSLAPEGAGGSAAARALPPGYRWMEAEEMEKYAFPNLFLRIIREFGDYAGGRGSL